MQTMTMNTTRQLVADHQAALGATARRGRLLRRRSRADDAQPVSLDLTVLEHSDGPAPDARRADKVA